jgi:hypothetical protein
MKKLLFVLAILAFFSQDALAQSRTHRKVSAPKNNRWRDDSLLWVKQPGAKQINSPRDAASGQATSRRKQPAGRRRGSRN